MDNKVVGLKGNIFRWKNAYIQGLRLSFHGEYNEVIIGDVSSPSVLKNCHIKILGSHNKIIINSGVMANDLTINCVDNYCQCEIEEKTMISGKTELAVMEGTKIKIGRNSLFSANITLRSGDSHSVIDAIAGNRINPSKDIIIGEHVWVGNSVIITKGSEVGDNSIIATGAIVAGKKYQPNSVIAGNPAKVVKCGVNWTSEKLTIAR